jgi:hydrogenase-4 component B
MNSLVLLFAVCWPIALVAGLMLPQTRGLARLLAPWAALPALLSGAAGAADLQIGWLMLEGRLGLDAVAVVMLPCTAGLWLAAGMFAQRYLEPGPRRDLFFGWFLAAMAGNLLLLAALDVVVFYLGFALMSFASYGLVVHEDTARARHAGRYYIAMVVIGEVCVISALMLLASRGGIDFASLRASFAADEAGRNDLIMTLLVVGFGIKAGSFGLHFWLPLAHPVAPAPASAVLSGAMIKAGLVAWIRLLPLGEAALPAWGAGLAAAGLFTAYYGVLVGLPQREAKTVLAYSSVSQMGVMTVAIGLGLAFPAQWPALFAALLVYMVHHSLVKGGLFLGAGLVQHALRPAAARLVAALLVLGALAIAGGPFTGGLVAKLALKHTAEFVAAPWQAGLPVLLTVSSGLTALLMLRFLWIAWPRGNAEAEPAPLGLLAPWLLLALAWLAAPWLLAAPGLRAEAAGLHAAWTAAGPLALAILLAITALRLRARLPGFPSVPAGDVGIPLERGLVAAGRGLRRLLTGRLPDAAGACRRPVGMAVRSAPWWSDALGHGEARITAWSVTGLLVVVLAVSFALLLA